MGDELTQVFLIIVILLAVFLGLNFWIKRGGVLSLPSFHSSEKSDETVEGTPTGSEAREEKTGRKKGGSKSSAVDRHGDRFNLTGKDAEAAARVLKRMLRQDQETKKG